MQASKQTKEKGVGVVDVTANRKLKAALEQAFMVEPDSKIGKNCNLGNIVVTLMKKNYSRGSPFDALFTHSEMVPRPQQCPETGSTFTIGENEKILHTNILPNGRIDYGSLGCGHACFNRLDSIDSIQYGAKVRQQLEGFMAHMTKIHGIRKELGWTWGVELIASSHRARQSLLVFRLSAKNVLWCSGVTDNHAVFAVVPTSKRMERDAFEVADHMISKEGYPSDHTTHLTERKLN